MHQHRFRAIMDAPDLPDDAPGPLPPGPFVLFPVIVSPGMAGPASPWPHLLYQIAFQQAQAVHEPSLLQRQLAPSSN